MFNYTSSSSFSSTTTITTTTATTTTTTTTTTATATGTTTTTVQLQQHQLHYNYSYTTATAATTSTITLHFATPHYILQLWVRWPLQPLQKSQPPSVHQWSRSTIHDAQQPTSPIGFLFLKLPPPPCAVLLISNWVILYDMNILQ